MKAFLRPETFKNDIVANLPFELSMLIFSYLDVDFLVRSRRVSRKWCDLLSSSPKLSPSYLRSFFGVHDPHDIGKGTSMTCGSPRTLEELAAYRTGRAFARRSQRWNLKPSTRPDDLSYLKKHTAYYNGTVAWIDNGRGLLRTLRLDASMAYTYVAREREKLTCITVSGSIVAATTVTGRCYIFELESGVAHVIRLRSASVSSLVSTGDTIAILHKPVYPDFLVYVTTWSLTSRKTLSFSPDIGSLTDRSQRYGYRVLVDPSETSVIYFEQTVDSATGLSDMRGYGNMTFFATRLALNGQVMSRSSYHIDGACQDTELGTRVPPDNGGPSISWSEYPYMISSSQVDIRTVRLTYHLDTDSLDLKILPKVANAPRSLCSKDLFCWKDIGYGFLKGDGRNPDSILVTDFDTGVCKEAEMWSLSMTDREADLSHAIRGGLHHQIVGDGRFVLLLHPAGFIAWSFDKTITMADESTLYREARAKEMKRRMEDKENLKARAMFCGECHHRDGLVVLPPPAEITSE